jgi:hypothetical protein
MNEALEVFVKKEVDELGYDLVELRKGGTARRPLLDVRIDRRDGAKITIDSHDFGAFLCKSQRRGPPVAHSFARALARADNDGGLSF